MNHTLTRDPNDSDEFPLGIGEQRTAIRITGDDPTRNLASYCLRQHEEIRSTIYAANPAAETMIIDQRSGTFYRYEVPTFTPLTHGPDAWVFDLSGELQEPPTGNPPPLPPPPPPTSAQRPPGYHGGRRRPVPTWAAYLIGAGAGTVLWSVLVLAVLAVFW